MALPNLKLQHKRALCQEKGIDYAGLRRKNGLIAKINEFHEAMTVDIDDAEGEDEVEFDDDVASVTSQSVSQNGGSNCGR